MPPNDFAVPLLLNHGSELRIIIVISDSAVISIFTAIKCHARSAESVNDRKITARYAASIMLALKTSKVQYLRLSILVWVSQVFEQNAGRWRCVSPPRRKYVHARVYSAVVVNNTVTYPSVALSVCLSALPTQISRRSLYRWQHDFKSSAQAGSVVICAGPRQCLQSSALVTIIRQKICRR